jgi:hypothetical protein
LYLVNHIVEDWGNAQNRDLREAHSEDPVEPAEEIQFGIHAELGNICFFCSSKIKCWQIYSEQKKVKRGSILKLNPGESSTGQFGINTLLKIGPMLKQQKRLIMTSCLAEK